MEALVTPAFWSGRRVFLTGHTGFKGSWLALRLSALGAQTTGFALAPDTDPNLFTLARVGETLTHIEGDIRDRTALTDAVRSAQPEIVLHLAAQPLVRAGYESPVDTFATNVMGTAHMLEACRDLPGCRAIVVVTTDKVYRNLEQPYPYREDDPLGGHDPYSASKAAAELVAACWRDSFLEERGIAVATARAGNVIGGGDWSADRLLPDAVRAWEAGTALTVRRPEAIRPWQHVLEAVDAYLVLAERLWHSPNLAGAWNFGPETGSAATVRTVIELARGAYGAGDVHYADEEAGPHEAGWLALEIAKARHVLGVHPRWSLEEAVRRTVDWHRRLADGADGRALCQEDARAFEDAA
ncbi:MAG TPA: CDP-glucose 4,6-dehydratase [Sphingomicrobium sp.]|nr:CDP-glucose 4,6-dehydratase [Sphingomicrobium sp.]